MQARAEAEVSKLGDRLEEVCRNIEPRARSFASEVQKRSVEFSRLSERFLLRGDPDAVIVPESELPAWLSLQSHAQRRVHNEVARLGHMLGEALKPQLVKARDAITRGKTANESADQIRGALRVLTPLVDRLNQPYGESTETRSEEL